MLLRERRLHVRAGADPPHTGPGGMAAAFTPRCALVVTSDATPPLAVVWKLGCLPNARRATAWQPTPARDPVVGQQIAELDADAWFHRPRTFVMLPVKL